MPQNDNCSRLKLVHIIYLLVVVVLGVGISWGVVVTRQSVNCEKIEKKVDKEVFALHLEQQRVSNADLKTTMTQGFERIEKRLDK